MTSAAAAILLVAAGHSAYAFGDETDTESSNPSGPGGGAHDQDLVAYASHSRITVRQVRGSGGTGKKGNLAPVDSSWEPPACWYEPVFTPEQLKAFVDRTDGSGDVGIHESWYGKSLWTDHYQDGKPGHNFDDAYSTADGYKDYNIGKGGYFWRSVAPDPSAPASWDCGRIMFWQAPGRIPDVPHAPTAKTLAEFAYDKIRVPDTEIELKPAAKSTVNLPTWVWLDKGTFQEVTVRAELPHTGLWAETTAKPVSLHLDPGTPDAETSPASGECEINADGSIGTPYAEGSAARNPPCGITYLRASGGAPYSLKASVTWQITWKGSGGSGDTLPSGTFETTQDMNVQEIQSVNR
ncbi:hypothetical protein [Streptomyces sp. NPDC088725]|uniref:hypothetical protein n=1 Tax=Streptomyces sp. NPDC088725 TaxID=3365873 RepID=UPI00381D394A